MEEKPYNKVDIDEYLKNLKKKLAENEIKKGSVLGDYTLEEKLSSNVFKAKNKANETVAVKVIKKTLFGSRSKRIRRFKREAEILSRLNHPNIVKLRDFGEEDWVVYYAMDFIEGEDLFYLIEKHGQLSVPRTLRMAKKIASALSSLHKKAIYHRDLKPSNIMVKYPDQENEDAILIDFGIVKVADITDLTGTGTIVGTYGFIPPEQLDGQPADARGDIYSLTTIVYQALSGRPVFIQEEGESDGVFLARTRDEKPPMLIEVRSISPELNAVVEKNLDKDPYQRCQNCEEYIAALEKFI
ncbi:serine/threonine protein kinase [Candidatus Woesearchaeota archaeon]|nr:serine/threonine protein kinase [Candidatus Woesearchaeota archaeon]